MRKFLTTLLVLLCAYPMWAQTVKVSGVVTGPSGDPEPGVVVFVKGDTGTGTMTDIEGRYSIQAPSGASLVFTSMGFKELEIPVAGKTQINAQLQEDFDQLEEAVVLGYSTQRKKFLVGSVSQVTSKDIMKAPTTNVQSLLTGRLAGLTNIQTSGTPGDDASTMLVRGYTTFNNSSPLCIVDGVERPFNYLNPNDIASVSVLKDAATAAIYGVRGANGVILVTTKTGAQGTSKISYDGSVSFDTNTAVPDFCNADQYIYWHNKAREMDGLQPYWTEENLAKLDALGILGDTDWLAEIYNPYGMTQQHNLSASGGTDKVRYYTSIGFMDQDGILKCTSFDRYNVRANIEATLAEGLKFSINMAGNHSLREKPGYSFATGYDDQGSTRPAEFSPITQAYYAIPLLKPAAPDGIAVGFHNGTYTRTPLAALTESGYQEQKRYNLETSTKLEYAFNRVKALEGLRLSIFAAYNYTFTADRNYMSPFDLYMLEPTTMTLVKSKSMGISERNYNKSASYGWNMTVRPQIDYARSFGKHNVSALALFERYKHYGDTMTAYAKGFYSDNPVDISLGMDRTFSNPSGSYDMNGFASFAGQFNYAYDEKYLLGVTLRDDASYKFAPEDRWGFFPSVAAGWVISQEPWFKPLSRSVNFLKLRSSYGELGSDDTDAYLYTRLFSAAANAIVIGGQPQSDFYTTGYLHKGLTWSHTKSYNVGFDSRFFKNKLSIEFDWFYKLTDRILEIDSVGTYAPSLGGNNPSWMNTGKMDNRGFELNIRHDNWFSNGFTYSVTGMVSWSRNRVLAKRISDNHPSYRAILGNPMGIKYGFHALGLFQTQEEVDAYPTAPSGWVDLGDIKYEDVNGDGKINSGADYVKIGRSSIPEMTFSMNFELGYKNLSLSALFQGATLCDYNLSGAYNNTTDNTMFTRAFYGGGNSVLYLLEDAWTPENTDARYPRLRSTTNANNAWASDWWIIDGSYLRLKNLQLTYTLPKKWLDAVKMDNIRVFVAGTNLFTLSHFKYLDPENPGVNNGYYPQQRTASLGLNLTF